MSCPMPVIPDAARTAVSVTRSDTHKEAPVAVFAREDGIQVFVPMGYPRSAAAYVESHATSTGIVFGGTTAWVALNDTNFYSAGLVAEVTAGLRNTVEHLQQATLPVVPSELEALTAEALRAVRSRQNEDLDLWAKRLIQGTNRADEQT